MVRAFDSREPWHPFFPLLLPAPTHLKYARHSFFRPLYAVHLLFHLYILLFWGVVISTFVPINGRYLILIPRILIGQGYDNCPWQK